jgi:hypothetical protein
MKHIPVPVLPTINTVTKEGIAAKVVDEKYHVFPSTTLTVCCLTMANGFTVTGEAACAFPENFKAATGEYYAREAAMNKIWALEGYLLRQRLSESEGPAG